LKDHSDTPAKIDNVHLRRIHIDSVELNCARGDACPIDEIVHAIDAAQECGLAATGGPDERRYGSRRHFQRHFVEDLMTSVSKIKIANRNHRLGNFGVICGLTGLR
jgi:hypothetical protein